MQFSIAVIVLTAVLAAAAPTPAAGPAVAGLETSRSSSIAVGKRQNANISPVGTRPPSDVRPYTYFLELLKQENR
jgi:hypothetical protein